MILIVQLVISEGLEGHTAAVLIPAYQHRKAAHLVTGGDDLVIRSEDEDGGRAVHHVLGVTDAVNQIILLIDECGNEFGRVDFAGAHGHELGAHACIEVLLDQLVGIVDDAHGGDGEKPQMRADQQRLRVGIADAANAAASGKIAQVLLELGPEGGVLDIVDLALKALLPVVKDHAAPVGAQMGVVIHAEKDVEGNVAP